MMTPRYDYELQAWIVNGAVQKCGHRDRVPEALCYACHHAGEAHDAEHCEDCE